MFPPRRAPLAVRGVERETPMQRRKHNHLGDTSHLSSFIGCEGEGQGNLRAHNHCSRKCCFTQLLLADYSIFVKWWDSPTVRRALRSPLTHCPHPCAVCHPVEFLWPDAGRESTRYGMTALFVPSCSCVPAARRTPCARSARGPRLRAAAPLTVAPICVLCVLRCTPQPKLSTRRSCRRRRPSATRTR